MLNSGLTAFRAQKQIEQVPLWGQTMGDAGYSTSIVGKWHLSKTTLERSFRDRQAVYMDGMFESGPEAYNRPSPGNTWSPSDTSLKGQWLHAQDWRKAASEPIQHSAQVWADTAADRIADLSKRPIRSCSMWRSLRRTIPGRRRKKLWTGTPQARSRFHPTTCRAIPSIRGIRMSATNYSLRFRALVRQSGCIGPNTTRTLRIWIGRSDEFSMR